MKEIKSFWHHWKQGEVQWQIMGFSLLPWCNWYNDTTDDMEYTRLFAGWLWFQCKWVHV